MSHGVHPLWPGFGVQRDGGGLRRGGLAVLLCLAGDHPGDRGLIDPMIGQELSQTLDPAARKRDLGIEVLGIYLHH